MAKKAAALTVNGVDFTEKQLKFIVDSVSGEVKENQGSTRDTVARKIQRAYPDWGMPATQARYRFAYREALVKL